MMASTSRELAWIAIFGAIALFLEGVIRERLIVPQLSEVGEAPIWSWIATFTLPVLVFVIAGWRADGLVRAITFAGFAFFPWFVVSTIYWATEPGPDTVSMAEAAFWLAIPAQFGLWALVSVGGLVLKRVHRSFSAV